jgi:hypothetical protein
MGQGLVQSVELLKEPARKFLMPKQHIEGLLGQLHDKFATSDTSPEQEALLLQLQSQLAGWEGPVPPDGSVVTTAEMLLEELEEKHPHVAQVVRELVDALGKIGI